MIGYCVAIDPKLASFRLRVALPSKHLGMPHVIGGVGDVTFFYKNGNPALARKIKGPIVYDVVNAHFDDPDYLQMIELATMVTCSSETMRLRICDLYPPGDIEPVWMIPDPYENEEQEAAVKGDCIAWIGHSANHSSIEPYKDLPLYSVPTSEWSRKKEDELLACAAVVLLTGNNPGASANRPVKALRAGRFVVVPSDCPEAWKELSNFIWVGDVREGIRWAFANREEACLKVRLGQEYVRTRFSPQSIGSQWADLFASISVLATNTKTAGSVSISR